MTRDELTALLDVLRAGGVKRFRDGSVEVELFADQHIVLPSAAEPAEEELPQTPEQKREAELELLFKSSGSAVPARLKRPAA